MSFNRTRTLAGAGAVLMTIALGGCYEDTSDSATASTPPPDTPPSSTPNSSYRAPAQTALGGAKRVAENTRDRVADYQTRLEEEMDDD